MELLKLEEQLEINGGKGEIGIEVFRFIVDRAVAVVQHEPTDEQRDFWVSNCPKCY